VPPPAAAAALEPGCRRAGRAALVGEHLWTLLDGGRGRPLAEMLMFAVSYLAIATLTSIVGRQMRASQALADERGSQVANMAEVNELIIRRMRTGVLLVEGNGEIRLANEAAMLQLGSWAKAGAPWPPRRPELAPPPATLAATAAMASAAAADARSARSPAALHPPAGRQRPGPGVPGR
jgi:hypothetical protein